MIMTTSLMLLMMMRLMTDGECSFMPIDASDKTVKSLKRASLDAAIASLEPFSVDNFKVATSLSFKKERQRRATDKETRLVPSLQPEALCTGSMFSAFLPSQKTYRSSTTTQLQERQR